MVLHNMTDAPTGLCRSSGKVAPVLNSYPAAAPRRIGPLSPRLRRFVAFTWGSGSGLVLDFGIFTLLVILGAPALLANIVSSAAAITLTYFLVSRHSFGATATWRTYCAFVAWYASSALIVSTAIGVLGGGQTGRDLAWKLAFVPLTFFTNYAFGRWLFRPRTTRSVPLFRSARALRALRAPKSAMKPPPVNPGRSRHMRILTAHPWAASAVFVTIFFIFVFPLMNAMSFGDPTDRLGILRAWATRAAFALTLWCFGRWVIRFADGVARRDPFYRTWLFAGGAYLVVLLPLFFALYPGHWVQDEFDTVYGATHYFPVAWQGYFTHVYYAFCLYLFPSAVGIVIVQMVFACVVAGYAVAVLSRMVRRQWLAWLALLPLLSPAVLLNDFYPLRLTPYGYLLLLVLVHLLRRAYDPASRGSVRFAEFFGVSCTVGVLAFWRSEGIAALLLLPVAFVVLGLPSAIRPRPGKVLALSVCGVLVVLFSGWLSTSTADPKYQTTAMLNPLSTMIQTKLEGPNVEADLRAIDAVVPLANLRAMPSYTETPVLWAGTGLRPDFAEHLGPFAAAYIDIVIHNPGPFLDNRWRAFLAANSQDSWVPQVAANSIVSATPKFEGFTQSTLFAYPLNTQVKYQTARHLFMLTSDLQLTTGTRIFWNAIPAIVIAALAVGFGLLRRRWTLAACSAVVAGGAALIFLTEPASYFMYFVPAFLCGSVGGAAAIAIGIDRWLNRRSARAQDVVREAPQSQTDDIALEREPVLAGSRLSRIARAVGEGAGWRALTRAAKPSA